MEHFLEPKSAILNRNEFFFSIDVFLFIMDYGLIAIMCVISWFNV